jgi:hypothetical protein
MFSDLQTRGCLAYYMQELPVSYILTTFKTITAGRPEIQAFWDILLAGLDGMELRFNSNQAR